jgi:hypothetical protein
VSFSKRAEGTAKKKTCSRVGCENLIPDVDRYEYCQDPECLEARDYKGLMREYSRDYRARTVVHPPTVNLVIPKREHLIGTYMNIRCGARSKHGRCTERFKVPYSLGLRVYPKYCKFHRNEHKRERFESGKFTGNGE